MGLSVVTAAAKLPVSLAEAKEHLRVDHDADDALIVSLTRAAVEYAQNYTKRQFVQATFDYTLDAFPSGSALCLPRSPLVSVTSVSYIDTDGASQTFTTDDWTAKTDTIRGTVQLDYSKSWPNLRGDVDGVTVRFIAGYADIASVPEAAKAAVKLMVGHWYEHRESVVVGTTASQLPLAVDALLDTLRILEAH